MDITSYDKSICTNSRAISGSAALADTPAMDCAWNTSDACRDTGLYTTSVFTLGTEITLVKSRLTCRVVPMASCSCCLVRKFMILQEISSAVSAAEPVLSPLLLTELKNSSFSESEIPLISLSKIRLACLRKSLTASSSRLPSSLLQAGSQANDSICSRMSG